IGFLIFMACIVLLRLYAAQLPDYGIEKWWKVLVIDVPLHKNVKIISESDAHKNAGKYLFLDARSPEEYAVSHIKNAMYAGSADFNISVVEKVPKDTPIIVYCAVGIRSDIVADKLMDAGFKDVQNLYGGIFEWVNDGYNIVNDQNIPTQQIHGDTRFFFFWKLKGERVY
ncbi:MAG: rhodanese-like domain-containing protein, partial [Bacteroidota bacterium]